MDISNDRERRFELEERWLIAHDLCGLLDQVCNFVGRKVDGRTRLLCGHHGVRSDSKISCEKGCHLSVGRPNGPTWRRGALSAADLSFSIMASTLAASAMLKPKPTSRPARQCFVRNHSDGVSAYLGCEEASVKIKIFFGRKLVKGLIFIMPRLRERLLYL